MNEQTGLLLDAIVTADLDRRSVPSLEKRRLRAYMAMVAVDLVLIQICFAIASLVYEGQWWEPRTMLVAHTLLPLYFTIALYNNTYSTHSLSGWLYGARKALFALLISAALLNFIAFYTKSNAEFSRASVTIGLGLTAFALAGLRRIMPVFINRFWQGRTRNELVIVDGGPPFVLPGAVNISANDFGLNPSRGDPQMFDRLGNLLRNQDRVVVTCPAEKRRDWSVMLKSAGVFGEVVSTNAHDLGAIGVHHYGALDQTTLIVSNGPLGMRARLTKRLFDTAIAGVALLILWPVLLLIAALIKLEDGGPAFFVQRRMGKGNRYFDIIKFRSMRLIDQDDNGLQSTGRRDARITRIGAIIRRTSLDELPQLLNVLKGDMSMVGPRPHALGSKANDQLYWEADEKYLLRHSLKPGITGLAQIRGFRGTTEHTKDLTDRLGADLEYISAWSLARDVEILVRTLGVLRHDNAY